MKCFRCKEAVVVEPLERSVIHRTADKLNRKMCVKCWEDILAEFEFLRQEYNRLIQEGVHPKIASKHVQVLMEQQKKPSQSS